ncbi:uncharacterized protein LOC143625150 [Bidens hawaiensis]|uniref:uncharacterized protein LOC143625150 n=1 Tax=Bidens hawaiensis TaxID=980011 RepID=UPI004049B679
MAMHASRLTQDQNLNVHFDGVKINGSIAQKNKGLGGRKALNDISNSGKPSALQPSRKHNNKNVILIGEDLIVSKKAANPVGGRKALGDLTNSVKPSAQKQQQGFEENESSKAVAEEGFLHNHDECIKAQKKSMDLSEFLKTIGLDEGIHIIFFINLLTRLIASNLLFLLFNCRSLCVCYRIKFLCKMQDENFMMSYKMEEIPETLMEDWPRVGPASPICGSPVSPRLSMRDYDDFPAFVLIESPNRSK